MKSHAAGDAFGADIDYTVLLKLYDKDETEPYAPGQIVNSLPIPGTGNPKPRLISTSHIGRQNLSIRMQLGRFTRLTNAVSKKLAHLRAPIALHFAHYNFCRLHQSLRITPAMAAGIAERVWELRELVN
ncbi:MAG: hypothetical protein ACRD5G_12455 [Candidatus Acidiferrales bacterium]